jgi:uncharacterized damage-inducible protein DinB
MPLSPAAVASYAVKRTHEALLAAVEPLDEATFRASRGLTSPSIAFHLWHIARWADMLQARVAAMTDEMTRRLGPSQEIWTADGLTSAWGLSRDQLGGNESGMGMDEEVSVSMPLPDRTTLLDYVRRVFEAADAAVRAVDDDQLAADGIDLYGRSASVGAAIVSHIAHANRHLGMIEALKGIHGAKGTATV